MGNGGTATTTKVSHLSSSSHRRAHTASVTPTTLKAVQGQNAYMLFYVKRSLAYAAPHSKLLASNGESQSGKHPGLSGAPIGGRIGHPIIGMAV